MKLRNGFVTSFVLASDSTTTKLKLVIEVDITNIATHTVKTTEELNFYLDEYVFGCDLLKDGSLSVDSDCEEEYARYCSLLQSGKALYFGRLSNDNYDNPIENHLYEHGFDGKKNFEVISQ